MINCGLRAQYKIERLYPTMQGCTPIYYMRRGDEGIKAMVWVSFLCLLRNDVFMDDGHKLWYKSTLQDRRKVKPSYDAGVFLPLYAGDKAMKAATFRFSLLWISTDSMLLMRNSSKCFFSSELF